MPGAVKHAFPDSNILLHFPALDGLDWCQLCDAESVVVHITQPVVRELNKIKETGYSKAVRKRAATVQRRLRNLVRENGLTASISERVTLQLESQTPRVTSFEGLDPSVSDDVLIAAVLAFSREHSAQTLLLTDDNGLGLLIKAADWKIKAIEPSGDLRLPAEPDEDQKEQEHLRRKLAAFEQASPNLNLTFISGNQYLKMEPLPASIDAEVDRRLTQIKQDHPALPVPESTPTAPKRITVRDLMKASAASVSLRDPTMIRKYNADLTEYCKRVEDIFRNNAAVKARMIRLELQVDNSGAMPAKDVLVEMHFPNGLRVLKRKELKDVLQSVPEPPRNPTEFPYLRASDPLTFDVLRSIRPTNPNDPTLSIRETNSYEVRWRVPKLRQGYVSEVDPITLLFDAEPFSFEISYSIVADNCPITAKGSLHVVVDDPPNVAAST